MKASIEKRHKEFSSMFLIVGIYRFRQIMKTSFLRFDMNTLLYDDDANISCK